MEITEVRIKLMPGSGPANERLLAFASITLDAMFVVRDLKIIEGGRGVFVAMPSRKLTDRCRGCGSKNHLRARFCSHCGARLDENRAPCAADGRARLHADVAHPIHAAARAAVSEAVLAMYADELERSREPGYVPRYDDLGDDDLPPARALHPAHATPPPPRGARPPGR